MVKKDDAKTEVQIEILSGENGDQFYKDIPDYRTASDDVRTLMEKRMATVNWQDLKSIIEFCKEDREDILRISREVNDRAMRDNSFIAEMRECAEAVGGIDLDLFDGKLNGVCRCSRSLRRPGSASANLISEANLEQFAQPVDFGHGRSTC